MEQRKIMSLGRSSLVISLPKRWIKLNELERGDSVSLDIQREGSLTIFPGVKKNKEPRKITLRVEPAEKEDSLAREIIACYLNGYFGITLISTDIFTVEQQKAVRAIAGILYMGILESDARRIYIQALVDESKAPLETALRRMHTISGSMCRDAIESLRNEDVELAKVVYALDDDVDQLSFFLIRLIRGAVLDPDLAKQLNLDPLDCLDYQTLVHRIEHVADHAAAISRNVISLGRGQWFSDPMLEYILGLGNETLDFYNESVRAFFLEDAVSSKDLIERQQELDTKLAACTVSEPNPHLSCMMGSIRDSLRRIAEYAADIAEVILNHSYRQAAK